MDRLFEKFGANWLRQNLPKELEIRIQDGVNFDRAGQIYFQMDLVLRDQQTKAIKCILDTKYKSPQTPASPDVEQVIAYADLLNCNEAVLIYPTLLPIPIDNQPGRTRVRSLSFDLNSNLEEAGTQLIKNLLIN